MIFKAALVILAGSINVALSNAVSNPPNLPKVVVTKENPGLGSRRVDRSSTVTLNSGSSVTIQPGVDYKFETPNFQNGNYTSNSNKISYLTVPINTGVTIECPFFELEGADAAGNCWDLFGLHLGVAYYSFCGTQLNNARLKVNPASFQYLMKVEFVSDSVKNFRGFECIISETSVLDSTTTTPASTTTTPASTTTTSQNDGTSGSSSDCDCGIKGSSSRIVGGSEATEAEYPWQVGLAFFEWTSDSSYAYSRPFCGGTIIDKKYVLTAAHCTDNMNTTHYRVLIGEHNTADSSDNSYNDFIPIEEIINHEGYDPVTIDNDYALIKLGSTLDFSRHDVGPACMPEQDPYTSGVSTATVTGWGHTSFNGIASTVLLEANVNLVSRQECAMDYQNVVNATITNNMLCANAEGKSSCQGDSGGPLVAQRSDGRYEVIGVVSYGVQCSQLSYPGVYADVYQVKNWIGQKIQGDTSLTCLASFV